MERLYTDLAHLWRQISPPERHHEEALLVPQWLTHALGHAPANLLELGCGGGHLAAQLPDSWALTLVDQSQEMLALAKESTPRASLVQADMRTLRLQQTFDAALIHDALGYLRNEADLAKTLATAAAHLRPGGALLLLPDLVREDFVEQSVSGGTEHIRILEWHHDPDPADDTYQIDFALLERSDAGVACHHDVHTMGMFSRETWARHIRGAGFALLTPEPWDTRDAGGLFLARNQSQTVSISTAATR